MKKIVIAMAAAMAAVFVSASALAQTSGTPVFSTLPAETPPNVPSLGFQATQTREFGDQITLAGVPRYAGYATVLMSSWSLRADYPDLSDNGYPHEITLNIYTDDDTAWAQEPVRTITRTFTIPWRPAADPTCAGGKAWRSKVDQQCYNGQAFLINFDLRELDYYLPNTFIYGIAYNTNTWGYEPINQHGPYESLNVGYSTTGSARIGTDPNTDVVYWNTMTADNYTDGGTEVGKFRPDTAWTGYVAAVQFTAFGFPTDGASCKKDGWKQLVRRSDFSAFKNQGDCVSYVSNGK